MLMVLVGFYSCCCWLIGWLLADWSFKYATMFLMVFFLRQRASIASFNNLSVVAAVVVVFNYW